MEKAMKKFLIAILISCLLLTVGCDVSETTSENASSSGSVNKKALTEDQQAILKINNYATLPAEKIETETKLLQPYDEYWDYNHQPSIAIFRNRIFVAYDSGHDGEANCGQRVMITSSSDFHNWTKPFAIVDRAKGYYSDVVSYPIGLYATEEQLVLYYYTSEYKPESLQGENKRPATDGHKLWGHCYYKITTDGVNWSEGKELGYDGSMIASPMPTSSGRLIMPSSSVFLYTDDKTGITGWTENSFENDDSIWEYAGLENGAYSEASFYEYDNYIYMLCRTGTQYLAAARSNDDGITWSKPFLTSFSDNASKFAFTTLPDGRIAYVGNPSLSGDRIPLMLCISENGRDFDKQYIIGNSAYTIKKTGFAKVGHYGYPAVCTDDEYLYIVYSKGKEILEIARVKLSELK